ncbi:GNAT family N-acetyltransferase [Brevibacillus fluminis]|uniref:GNAT family N-acetyltransferase n=1 Tax=Brevibacillus fluminis TaxID=511487 RepID=UPI003F8A56AC
MIDLKERLHEHDVLALLAHAVGAPTLEKLQQVAARYEHSDSMVMVGMEEAGVLIGCIGLDLAHAAKAVIMHVAVQPDARGKGIGRRMLADAMQRFSLTALGAETDASAVGFYRSCGFTVKSLGEKYPGVERFWCEREAR